MDAKRRRTVPGIAVLSGFCLVVLLALSGCTVDPPVAPVDNAARLAAIPAAAVRVAPAEDPLPPVIHLSGWGPPLPLGGSINTAGAEDSPFVTPDGSALYFFFTPDMHVPPIEQAADGVTGIWVSRRMEGAWAAPERVVLHASPCLEGCQVVVGDTLWFGAVRAGNLGEIDLYTARREAGRWVDLQNAGRQLNVDYDVGEFHPADDGRVLCFDSSRPGSLGGRDLWVTRLVAGQWSEPENLGPGVNTVDDEGQPFITADGSELWFTGQDRLGQLGNTVWRSLRNPDGSWGTAELVVSGFAGEPCLDAAGNLYFVHHLFRNGEVIEADVYVAERQ